MRNVRVVILVVPPSCCGLDDPPRSLGTRYRNQQAVIAEAVIGAVMLLGLGVKWLSARRQVLIRCLALAFGLSGTLVGMFTIIGVGPHTTADIVYHLLLITLLATGPVVAWKAQQHSSRVGLT